MPITTLNYIHPTSPDIYLERTGYDQAAGARLAHLHPIIDKINEIITSSTGTQKLFSGVQTTPAGIVGEVGTVDSVGSIYVSTNGELFIQVADTGASTDWVALPTCCIPVPPSPYSLGLGLGYNTLAGTTLTVTAQYFTSGNIGENTLVGVPSFGVGYSNLGTTGIVAAKAAVAALHTTLSGLSGTVITTPYAIEGDNYGYGTGVFVPGVYKTASAIDMSLTSTITLNGDGDYIFVSTGGAITFGANDNIVLTNGAKASRVYWVANTAITIGASNNLKGNFMSGAAGAITTGASTIIEGRLLSPIDVTVGATNTLYLPLA